VKTGKTLGIFSLILLLMVLIVVVGARTRQETEVVMDGGTAPAATATDARHGDRRERGCPGPVAHAHRNAAGGGCGQLGAGAGE